MVFSGPGRHRRPTQADRAVATATAVGAGLALPLLAATGAHAAPVSTWDAVAQCATGGNWTMDTGDGYYGGLRLTERQWEAHGGDLFGAEPSHGTEQQQITVAEAVLAEDGPGVWGTCATTAGLTAPSDGSATPGTPAPGTPAPGTPTPGAPAPSGSAAPGTPSAPGTPAPTPSGAAGAPAPSASAAPATPAPSSPVPSAPAPSAPAPSAPTPAAPSASPSAAPTPSAAPGSPAQSATPAPVPTPAAPAPAQPAPGPGPAPTGGDYTVVSGDTLSGIAYGHHLDGWQQLYQQNAGVVGDNPNLIFPGQHLHLS